VTTGLFSIESERVSKLELQKAMDTMCALIQSHIAVVNHLVDESHRTRKPINRAAVQMETQMVTEALSTLVSNMPEVDDTRWRATAVVTVYVMVQDMLGPRHIDPEMTELVEEILRDVFGWTMDEFIANVMPGYTPNPQHKPKPGPWW
jgi:hypothetical protein